MFLKSVTLRGFKSFADKTELTLEPGITVVVGPNGSGKSNIVDALTWVLGSHSPKSLRGGSMSDVIFAGAPGRSALGQAAVEIHIDNSSGLLPIEFSEVTVSRSMYASGENAYAINGVACRLLDVAELLSDTGLGRENHTIVGQGRLDAILNARPEERRAFIEEAAGILKHRRRKERALRKLGQMEEHVERLTDLLRELRRQLRPLEKQAQAATRHRELRARRDEVRRVRALRELDRLDVALTGLVARDRALADDLGGLATRIEQARTGEVRLEAILARSEPEARRAATTHVQLSTLVERFRAVAGRIDERRQGLTDAVEEPVAGRDPAALRVDADAAVTERDTLGERLRAAADALAAWGEERTGAERRRRAHGQAAAAEARRRAEARERLLRWEGQVSALRSALAQAGGEEGRLSAQTAALQERGAALEADVAAAGQALMQLEGAAPDSAERVRRTQGALEARTSAVDELVAAERSLERERASLTARAEALRATAAQAGDGVRALLDAADGRGGGIVAGVVGPLAAQLDVAEGMGPAVAAALGRLGEAVVVDTVAHAVDAVGFVEDADRGRVLLLVNRDALPPASSPRSDLTAAGARPLLDAVGCPAEIRAALAWALGEWYVVADLEHAARLAAENPACSFVTTDGRTAGATGWVAGAGGEPTAVVALAGAEDAERRLMAVEADLASLRERLDGADAGRTEAAREHEEATAAQREIDGRVAAARDRLSRLRVERERAERETAARRGEVARLADDMAERRRQLAELEARGADPVEEEPDGPDLEAERLDDELAAAREQEVEARLELRSLQEADTVLAGRVRDLRAEADEVERQLAERERRRAARVRAIARCRQLADLADAGADRAARSLAEAEQRRDELEQRRDTTREELGALRARLRELEESAGGLRESRHALALERQEAESAAAAVRDRLVLVTHGDPDELLAAARAAREEPDGTLDGGPERDDELAEAERRLDKQIGLIGEVNPHARREFDELTERHGFLEAQLADLRESRDDLLEVVDTVDTRIREVFADAFADVAAAFEQIFPRLFPGGEGNLLLTDPDDLLTSGVEVEARPAGKRVNRLSLLSGGERSLTALALTFAIFSARPSPFYVLDEVEAALDDVNLQRFLDVVTDFRSTSQLIVVSHQKRTMEVADLLYGVSMRSDGVSRVISQRSVDLADPVPAGA